MSLQGAPPERMRSKFCSQCGGAIGWGVPPREHSWRLICGACGFVDYMNPKMVSAGPRSPGVVLGLRV